MNEQQKHLNFGRETEVHVDGDGNDDDDDAIDAYYC